MKNEKIIEQLDSIIGTYEILVGNGVNSDIIGIDDIEALREAIKLLKAKPCGDCVSRELVIDYLLSEWNHELKDIVKGIRALPPVTPAPKIGRWILTDDDLVYCSECEDSYYPRPIDASWYYCPHCGAKMEEEEDT